MSGELFNVYRAFILQALTRDLLSFLVFIDVRLVLWNAFGNQVVVLKHILIACGLSRHCYLEADFAWHEIILLLQALCFCVRGWSLLVIPNRSFHFIPLELFFSTMLFVE